MKRALVLVVFVAGCASSSQTSPDGRAVDAAAPIDAPIDGASAQRFRPGAELVVAGGRVAGGSRAIELEVGHWVEQGEASVGTRRLTGAAVVFP
jgi:hypothetical protein